MAEINKILSPEEILYQFSISQKINDHNYSIGFNILREKDEPELLFELEIDTDLGFAQGLDYFRKFNLTDQHMIVQLDYC